MVRELVLSRAFAMTSEATPASFLKDPDNRLLWRFDRRRMEAEALRDSMLRVAGILDEAVGGPMFPTNLGSVHKYTFDNQRRSIYQPIFRNNIHSMFAVFDVADPNLVVGSRSTSTLPTQSLFLMNSPRVMAWAEAAAKRLLALPEAERLDTFYRLAFARDPRASERQLADAFLGATPDQKAWAQYVQTLFASNEFRYVF